MHEASIMERVLEIACDRAQASGAQSIRRLTLRVGSLSGVVPEALEFAFAAASPETLAAGADLAIDRQPAICWCDRCEAEFEPADWIYECPTCGQIVSEIRQGREIELVSLEVL